MKKNLFLSIIVVNFNHKYFPRMCVEALQKSVIDFDYEIIFVDNASSDESIEYLRKAHLNRDIKLIESDRNLGYGQANNLAVKHAKGDFILICNPDIFVNQDSLQKLVDYLKKHEEIGILAPKLMYHNGHIQESCRRFMTFTDVIIKRTPLKYLPKFKKKLSKYLMHDFNHNKIQNVDLVTGACFLMQKKVYNELKGFDPRYFLFMEDFDLCQRVHKAGYKVVYYPEVSVLHFHKRLSGDGFFTLLTKKVFWLHVSSAIKYFWRWR
ncbi:hypothetical protein A2307_00590 [Candidatus Peregrinibacteria bacterium RIFOXYB2_FULL_33_20]|nr:MAG: hypothetical protein A2307_00590 [Candidatus Peregrinibacteria bacterium RIFOXYB2_FULL_33_20]